jgi:hypothetical protein
MRVLITNYWMRSRTGTELYAAETARALRDAGHQPMILTMHPGELADGLAAEGIPVFSDPAQIGERPDVIHGQHNVPVAAAMLRFPGVPVISFCHDATHWLETPPAGAVMAQYVAVGEACRDRLVMQHGVPSEQVLILPNAPDLERFRPRAPLPRRPARALAFSNYWSKPKAQVLEAACRECGIALDVVGFGMGTHSVRPEELLVQYDLVLAIGRCALESIAVGAAVVLCGVDGVGSMVTLDELDELARQNMGRRTLRANLNPAAVIQQIRRYDAAEATRVTARLRAGGGQRKLAERLVGLYRSAIAAGKSAPPDAAAFLVWYDRLKQRLHHYELAPLARENYELRLGGAVAAEPSGSETRQAAAPIALVTGVPGSGTELLRQMLNAHRDLAVVPETGRDADAGFPPREIFIRSLVEQAAGKPRLGEESAAFCFQVPAILRELPEARVIHVVRDGRDIAAELCRQSVTGRPVIREIASKWARQVRQAQWDARRQPSYFEVRFEELADRPALVLGNICAHLEMEYDGAMLEGRGWGLWGPCSELARVGLWRRTLTSQECDEFEREAGDLLGELGYLA